MKLFFLLFVLSYNCIYSETKSQELTFNNQLQSGFEILNSLDFQSLDFGSPVNIRFFGGDIEGNGGNWELSNFYDILFEELVKLENKELYEVFSSQIFLCLPDSEGDTNSIFQKVSDGTILINCSSFSTLKTDVKRKEIMKLIESDLGLVSARFNTTGGCEENFNTYTPLDSNDVSFGDREKFGKWINAYHPNLRNFSIIEKSKARIKRQGYFSFIRIRDQIKKIIDHKAMDILNDFASFREALDSETVIKCSPCPNLLLDGANVVAINIPDLGLIEVNCTKFKSLSFKQKTRIVIHEFLGLSGLDDSNYQLSKTLQKVLF